MPSVPPKRRQSPDLSGGLPADLDTERFVLGSILLNAPRHLPSVRARLNADDFHLRRHQQIYQCALDLDDRGVKVDRITVADELRKRRELGHNGISFLVSLDDQIPDLRNVSSWVDIVLDKSALRRVICIADAAAKRALHYAEPSSLIVASVLESFRELHSRTNPQADPEPPSILSWPDPIAEAGFYGIAGELVRLIEPNTEADNAALLLQFLIGWGSLAGRGAYYQAEADYHHTNEYAVIVGTTAKGRKGTSWGRVRGVLRALDEHWADKRLLSGIGSGEALIDAVAEEDHRTLVIESEFARLLAVIAREATTTSAVLRDGWDSGTLSTWSRTKKVQASGAHLSMLGHITQDELRRRLSDTELANGFANRILWVCARRSKSLPHGGGSPDMAPLTRALLDVKDHARRLGNTRLRFDNAARELWETVYPGLSAGKPGMLGAMTSRAEAHVVRLAVIYALLDRANEISIRHLDAALAVWKYCDDSARFIWGDAIGDAAADEILKALRSNAKGMTRTDIRDLFGRNSSKLDVDRALGVLVSMGLARKEEVMGTGGRPAEWWHFA